MKDIYFVTGIIANIGITYGIYKFFNLKGKLEDIIMDIKKNMTDKKIVYQSFVYSPETIAQIETYHQRNVLYSNPVWTNESSGVTINKEQVVEERLRRLSDVKNSDRWW